MIKPLYSTMANRVDPHMAHMRIAILFSNSNHATTSASLTSANSGNPQPDATGYMLQIGEWRVKVQEH